MLTVGKFRPGFRFPRCSETLYRSSRTLSRVTSKSLPTPRHVVSTVRGGVLKYLPQGSDHCGMVPLLNPMDMQLPFAASLEFVCGCKRHIDDANHEDRSHESGEDASMIDLIYVLSGTGALVESTNGRSWAVHAGMSVVTRSDSTQLVASSPMGDDEDAATPGQDRLAVLKFHLPVALLHPQQAHYNSSSVKFPGLPRSWEKYLDECRVGVLQDQDAVQLLTNLRDQARQALNSFDEGAEPPPSHAPPPGSAGAPIPLAPPAHGAASRGARTRGPSPPASHLAPAATAAMVRDAAPVLDSASPVPNLERLYRAPAARPYGARDGMPPAPPQAAPSPSSRRPLPDMEAPGSHGREHVLGLSAKLAGVGGPVGMGAQASGGRRAQHSNDSVQGEGVRLREQLEQLASLGGTGSGEGDVDVGAGGAKEEVATSACVLMTRGMDEFRTFKFPQQSNQLALVFDPIELGLSFSFGIEVFTPGHRTPLHVHRQGYELFFVLAGEGEAHCDGHHIHVSAGDCIVFPPGTRHGLDNMSATKLYTIQMMCPDDEFVAFVQSGQLMGRLADEDICTLTAMRC